MALEKTWRWFGENDPVTLSCFRQIGVEGIVTALYHVPVGGIWSVEEILRVKTMIEQEGLHWSVVESLPVSEGIKIQSAGYEELLDNYKQSLRNLASCGINTVCYNFMPVLDWARTDLHYSLPDGTESMRFDYSMFAAFDIYILKRPGASSDYPEGIVRQAENLYARMSEEEKEKLAYDLIVVTQAFINGVVGEDVTDYKQMFLDYLATYREIGVDKLRQNLSCFLKEVVPVAEEVGIRLCIHPDDPPFPLLGLSRIASTLDDLRWICEQVNSLSNGITLCTGSLSARDDNNMLEIIRQLGSRIHFVHLRNTCLEGEKVFYESGHLDGSIDMYSVVKALLEEQQRRLDSGRNDFRIPFRPDHGLKMAIDFGSQANPGYPFLGRFKGLSQIDGLQYAIVCELEKNKCK